MPGILLVRIVCYSFEVVLTGLIKLCGGPFLGELSGGNWMVY